MSKSLLVVDDAQIMRTIIKSAIQGAGWIVAGEASNGRSAIELYQEVRPDAVTVDLVMPEYDGLHALHGILEFDPDAKVLIVTAMDQEQVMQDALDLGAAGFIIKPFECEHLIRELEKLVGTSKVKSRGCETVE